MNPNLIPVPKGMSPGFYAFMGAGGKHSDSGELLMLGNTKASTETEMSSNVEITSLESVVSTLAQAITPLDAAPGTDAAGGHIASLTEAVMGITSGLFRIAEAIDGLADAYREAEGLR